MLKYYLQSHNFSSVNHPKSLQILSFLATRLRCWQILEHEQKISLQGDWIRFSKAVKGMNATNEENQAARNSFLDHIKIFF